MFSSSLLNPALSRYQINPLGQAPFSSPPFWSVSLAAAYGVQKTKRPWGETHGLLKSLAVEIYGVCILKA
jgi:hypothetical protein